jgi:DNA-binding transcriptional LysR family regulator
MLDAKLYTLLAVAELKSFTKAAARLSLTQPAVSHHIRLLEEELGAKLLERREGEIRPTAEGEIAVSYARRLQALSVRLKGELEDIKRNLTRLCVGITHTAESNLITEVLAKYARRNPGISITVVTDTINNLYNKLECHELDLAVVEGKPKGPELYSVMLDTDYLVCAMPVGHPLSRQALVTLEELKKEPMILRLPSSATRVQFEFALESMQMSIADFQVALEVDNIATIKDLIRKELGISILAKSACMDEVRKGKLCVLPIENLSMVRETNLVYHKDFPHTGVLKELTATYRATAEKYE